MKRFKNEKEWMTIRNKRQRAHQQKNKGKGSSGLEEICKEDLYKQILPKTLHGDVIEYITYD